MGRVGEDDKVTSMVKTALQLGYRHIDTVSNGSYLRYIYSNFLNTDRLQIMVCRYPSWYFRNYLPRLGNEESVGKALKESNVPRDEIFLTTKLAFVRPLN